MSRGKLLNIILKITFIRQHSLRGFVPAHSHLPRFMIQYKRYKISEEGAGRMSAGRQFQLVYLLLGKGRLTAAQLARELEVSTRTVYRDLDALSAAGVPVCAAQGKGGGVYLMDGYVLDRCAFTEEEQRRLLTALRAMPEGLDGGVLAKLSALFRREGEDWLQVRLSRWGDGGEGGADDRLFRRLRAAVGERREVEFRYASSRGETLPRRVLPARLAFKGQGWYLQGYDLEREDYRTFRLTRILDLRETDRTFHRKLEPPDIAYAGEIPPLFRVECVLRFAHSMAYRVYDEFGPGCVTALPDGRLEVRAVFPEDQWLYGYLLSFGAGVEIVSPAALRRRVARLGLEIFKAHREPDTPCQVCRGTMASASKTKEDSKMDVQNMKFCQSCGMPLTPEQYGTEADGAPSEEYCTYCYQNGQFTREQTMDEMIDFCAPIMAQNNPGMTEEQAKEQMHRFFPMLKRWQG